MEGRKIFAQKPTLEIFPESDPNKEISGKMPRKEEELKEEDQEEEEESQSMCGKDWIKVGDEYFPNPVAMPPSEEEAVINFKEIAKEPSFQPQQKKNQRKRKFDAEKQEEPVRYTYFDPEILPGLLTKIPDIAFIKNHSQNDLKEKYVKLHVINRRFMSKDEEVEEEEEEEEILASPHSFRTTRKYLYRD